MIILPPLVFSWNPIRHAILFDFITAQSWQWYTMTFVWCNYKAVSGCSQSAPSGTVLTSREIHGLLYNLRTSSNVLQGVLRQRSIHPQLSHPSVSFGQTGTAGDDVTETSSCTCSCRRFVDFLARHILVMTLILQVWNCVSTENANTMRQPLSIQNGNTALKCIYTNMRFEMANDFLWPL